MKHSKVGALMTADVVRAEYGTPFKEVARRLAEHRISGLPVVDDDEKVLGVISETDVMARQAETRHKPGPPDSSCPVRPSRSTATRPWSRRPASWHSTASNGCRSSTTRSGSSASSPAAICSRCGCRPMPST
jgi:CBS-domain-containing membrane protein